MEINIYMIFWQQKRNEQATTISVVKTHFLAKMVARHCLIVKNYIIKSNCFK